MPMLQTTETIPAKDTTADDVPIVLAVAIFDTIIQKAYPDIIDANVSTYRYIAPFPTELCLSGFVNS